MKLKLPFLFLQAIMASFLPITSAENIPLPDNPVTGTVITLLQGENNYQLSQDCEYTGPICFRMDVRTSTAPAGSLSFFGENKNEILSFTNINTVNPLFKVVSYTGATLSFHQLGGMSITGVTATGSEVLIGAGSENYGPSLLQWAEIGGDVILSNNRNSNGHFINISAGSSTALQAKAGMTVNQVNGDFLMENNEARSIIYINPMANAM